MSILDRQWGTQVASGHSGCTHSAGSIAQGLDRFGLLVSDAAAVARLMRWSAIEVGVRSDGCSYVALTQS